MDLEKVFTNVVKYCHKRLFDDKEVMTYLMDKRQLTQETLEQFQVGLFPTDLRELFNLADPKDLRAAGIIKHASKSMFRLQRLVMPVQDVYGNCIALAGRTLLSEEERQKHRIPKYLNSVYDKSHHLFGLNFAKKHIILANRVYVVEGYFDVMMPHQKGFKNIVAICGAFLSSRHLALLSRYTDNIVLLLDNEPEAQERAKKIIEKKQRDGLSLVIGNHLPSNTKDVDEFLRKYSVEDLYSILNNKGSYDNIKPLWD